MPQHTPSSIRLGTRGSPLALRQAETVRDALTAAHPGLAVEIVPIRTTGDAVQDRRLSEIGGKGLFSKEIEQALRENRIEIAVHSLKDMETQLADGFAIAAVLPREDPRDALIAPGIRGLADLPPGAVIGTSSLRRQAQLLHRRRDLTVVSMRGNVGTRLDKLARGEAQATLLAMAGLRRLDLTRHATLPLDPSVMLPAAGQGAIAIECRASDTALLSMLAPLNDDATAACVAAERALLAALDGSCHTPIGGLATLGAGGSLTLDGLVATPDGARLERLHGTAPASDADALGTEIGRRLRAAMGAEFPL
ncbi:MAG: hydroxymethylbilane synthase [Alphaproteobacteria bacterium]